MLIKFQKGTNLTPWFESVFHSQRGISLHHTTVNQNAEMGGSIRPWHFSFWPQRRPGFPELCQCLEVGPLATELAQRKDKINASRWGGRLEGMKQWRFQHKFANSGRFVPQSLETKRKLIPRAVNAGVQDLAWAAIHHFAIPRPSGVFPSFIPYWTAAAALHVYGQVLLWRWWQHYQLIVQKDNCLAMSWVFGETQVCAMVTRNLRKKC